MYCSISCRDLDWKTSHGQSCFDTRNFYENDVQEEVLDLNKTQLSTSDEVYSFDNAANGVLQRLIHIIGLQKIQSAAMNNEPMLSWSANDPRTRGFRDGKFATVDLEALISLEDNFNKLDDVEKKCYAQVR
jgi:hypothetical protein